MDKNELFQRLDFIKNDTIEKSISFYVSVRKGEVLLFNIKDKDLPELRDAFVEYLTDNVISHINYNVEKYSNTSARENAFYWYDLKDKFTDEMDLLGKIVGQVNPQLFSTSKHQIEKITGLYIKIKGATDEQIVTLYKSITIADKTFVNTSPWYRGVIDDQFERQTKNMLRITAGAQMLRVGEEIILLDMKKLERSLNLDAILKKESEQYVEKVKALKLIENTTCLSEACKKPSLSKKLIHALTEGQVIKKGLTTDDIIKFASKNQKLKFKFNKGGTKLRIDSKAAAERFIKLMDDDYLLSALTNEEYDSIDKNHLE